MFNKKYIITAVLLGLFSTEMSFAVEALAPKGVIEIVNPTFQWKSVEGATEYKLGYENDKEEGWESYTIKANNTNCNNKIKQCKFKPKNVNFEIGVDMGWWIKAKVNGKWENWGNVTNFISIDNLIIDDGSDVVNGSHTEQGYAYNNYDLIIDDGSGVVNGSHIEQGYYPY